MSEFKKVTLPNWTNDMPDKTLLSYSDVASMFGYTYAQMVIG